MNNSNNALKEWRFTYGKWFIGIIWTRLTSHKDVEMINRIIVGVFLDGRSSFTSQWMLRHWTKDSF